MLYSKRQPPAQNCKNLLMPSYALCLRPAALRRPCSRLSTKAAMAACTVCRVLPFLGDPSCAWSPLSCPCGLRTHTIAAAMAALSRLQWHQDHWGWTWQHPLLLGGSYACSHLHVLCHPLHLLVQMYRRPLPHRAGPCPCSTAADLMHVSSCGGTCGIRMSESQHSDPLRCTISCMHLRVQQDTVRRGMGKASTLIEHAGGNVKQCCARWLYQKTLQQRRQGRTEPGHGPCCSASAAAC